MKRRTNLDSRDRAFAAAITDDSIEVQRVKFSHFSLLPLFSFTAKMLRVFRFQPNTSLFVGNPNTCPRR